MYGHSLLLHSIDYFRPMRFLCENTTLMKTCILCKIMQLQLPFCQYTTITAIDGTINSEAKLQNEYWFMILPEFEVVNTAIHRRGAITASPWKTTEQISQITFEANTLRKTLEKRWAFDGPSLFSFRNVSLNCSEIFHTKLVQWYVFQYNKMMNY